MDLRLLALPSIIINCILAFIIMARFADRKPSCPFQMAEDDAPPRPPVKMAPRPEQPRLTDLVIPFHAAHFDRVQNNLNSWVALPPCKILPPTNSFPEHSVALDQQEFYSAHRRLGHNITLTFAISSASNEETRKKMRQMVGALPKRIRGCFSKVRVSFSGLEGAQDGYLKGTRYMFEAMINGTIGLENPQYVLYMEPDMMPVRPYWLTALDATTRFPVAPFWVKGSLYRGGNRNIHQAIHNALHINGNAIYNLADPAFRHFYYNKVLPKIDHQDAYDVDVAKFMSNIENYNCTQEVRHMFHYTDSIQNWWRWKYSLSKLKTASPNLYLIHGGTSV